MNRRVAGLAVLAFMVVFLLAAVEGATRIIDGYSLIHLRLPDAPPRAATATAPAARDKADAIYFDKIPLARGVDPKWYEKDPPLPAPIPMTPEVSARFERYKGNDPLGAFFVWNPNYLKLELCGGLRFGSLGILDDFYVFEPQSHNQYPIYRHLQNIFPPSWFRSNRFGWRGPDVELNKPAQTIRIGFGGSSMTIDAYGNTFSHIEYIGEWLNLWAKARGYPFAVEIINTARTGVDASSVAAAVIEELLPLEPDLVIFDGANDFKPGLLLKLPAAGVTAPPDFGARTKWTAENYSAVARRLKVLLNARRPVSEPGKPDFPINWPAGVNEQDPDTTAKALPMQLDTVLANFDAMRTALESSGAKLALSSEVAMVQDGLTLQWPRDQTLFNFLNAVSFPVTYAQSRRLMDFQNRVYKKYAAQHGLTFFDKAAVSPLDPQLFLDMVHMTPPGLRLQSWLYFQWLAAWIDDEVAAGRLPRPMMHPLKTHPAFPADGRYPLLAKNAILESCK